MKDNAEVMQFSTQSQKKTGQTPVHTHMVFVDILNIVCALAVVMLHTSLNVYAPERTQIWSFSLKLQAVFIFAVPVFFMISGMNLLGYRRKYSTKEFFFKRVRRVGTAFLLGSILCYCLYCFFPHEFWGTESFVGVFGLKDFVKRMLTNSINSTYWFFYTIIYLYVLTPVLSHIAHHKRTLQYVLALTFFVGFLVPLAEFYGIRHEYFSNIFGWPFFASWATFYYVGGYYLHRFVYFKKGLLSRPFIWVGIYVIATLAMYVLTLYVNGWYAGAKLSHEYRNFIASPGSPVCVIQVLSVFLFVRSLEPWLAKLPALAKKILKTVSAAGVGIYLIQIPIINYISVKYDQALYAWLKDDAFIRGLFVFIVAAVMVVVLQGLWRALKRCATSCTKSL